jgi:predicted kinase
MKAIITIGLPGSGKSTYFKGHPGEVNRDDIRLDLFGEGEMIGYYSHPSLPQREKRVDEKRDEMISLLSKTGADVVISDTNLNPRYRYMLVEQLESIGFEVEYMVFDVPLDVCITRNDSREGWRRVPTNVLAGMLRSLVEAIDYVKTNNKRYTLVGGDE